MAAVYLIYNARSGNRDQLDAIKAELKKQGIEAHIGPIGPDLPDVIARAKQEGVATFIAAGGDGTVSAVAAELIGSECRMAVLPVGTLNHFAKDLGISLDLVEAVATILHGRVQAVDTAMVNGRCFINNSSIGLYPQVVRQREQSSLSKWPAAILATGKTLLKLKTYRSIITSDELMFARVTPFVFVGNNVYHLTKVGLAERTELTSGNLSLVLVKTGNILSLLRIMIRILFGRVQQEQDLETTTATKVMVKLNLPRVSVATDGEVQLLETPLNYTIRPCSLQVIVPKDRIV